MLQRPAEACTALTSDTLSSLLTEKLACPLEWLCQRPLSTKDTSPPGEWARVLIQSTALILCTRPGHVTGYRNSFSLTLTGLCWCCRRYGDSSLASLFVCMCSEDAAVTVGRNAEFTGKICFQVQKFGAGLLQPNNRCGRNAELEHDLTLTFVDDVAVIVGERQTHHLGACQADWSTRCISQNSMKATRCLHKSSECRNALACGAWKACMWNTIRRFVSAGS